MSITISTPRAEKNIGYAADILQALIFSLKSEFSQAEIADYLNLQGLRTPRGLPFTAASVKEELKKLRLPRYHGRLHAALLRLIFTGQISLKDSLLLVSPKRGLDANPI